MEVMDARIAQAKENLTLPFFFGSIDRSSLEAMVDAFHFAHAASAENVVVGQWVWWCSTELIPVVGEAGSCLEGMNRQSNMKLYLI
jgi:hypothetical protein